MKVTRIGKWTAVLTLVFGALLLIPYLLTRDVEAGTLLYFYVFMAGIVNGLILLSLLLAYFSPRQNKKNVLRIAVCVLISYLLVLWISFYG